MEPSEFLNPDYTVYKYSQVVTEEDLRQAIALFLDAYYMTQIDHERERIAVVIKTLDTMLEWIVSGKPEKFQWPV